MYYQQLIVPKNTSQDAPVLYSLEFAPGILRRVRVLHPTGCADLVGVSIHYMGLRLYPTNDFGWFLGNGSPIEFNPNFPLILQPYVLDIYAYNLDDTFEHKPTIALEIEALGSYANSETERMLATFTPSLPVNEG